MKNLKKTMSILDRDLGGKTNFPSLRSKPPLRIKIRKLLRSFIPPSQFKRTI